MSFTDRKKMAVKKRSGGKVHFMWGNCCRGLEAGCPSCRQPGLKTSFSNHQQTYNTMQCNAIQYNAIQRNVMQCNAMQYNAMQYNATQSNAMQHNAMQCNAIQRNAIQRNATQCNAMQYNAMLLWFPVWDWTSRASLMGLEPSVAVSKSQSALKKDRSLPFTSDPTHQYPICCSIILLFNI